jgi:hypothetical protein
MQLLLWLVAIHNANTLNKHALQACPMSRAMCFLLHKVIQNAAECGRTWRLSRATCFLLICTQAGPCSCCCGLMLCKHALCVMQQNVAAPAQ